MIRTGQEYRDAIRTHRDIYVDGERVDDVTVHPAFAPLVDLRAQIYDMQHDPDHNNVLTNTVNGQTCTVAGALPFSQADWWAKRRATDRIFAQVGGIATCVGDETIGEFWSLYDCRDALVDMDPQFARNIDAHIVASRQDDLFRISANTAPKGDRSRPPQEQDPDMLLRVVRETDAGIILRGAKFETGAPYADLAYTKPNLANWGDALPEEYAVGFVSDLNTPGLKFICRSGFARPGTDRDYPLSNRFDEIEALIVFDDVLIPWEHVLFHRRPRAATLIRATLHRYSAFAFVHRILIFADMLIGTALMNCRQTGLDKEQGVRDKLVKLAVWREGIHAHLTAAIALGEKSPAGLMMPNQSLLYAGRMLACSQIHEMMQVTRELCGGQLSLTPSAAAFDAPETAGWLQKYYTLNDDWTAEERRKLMAFARDLVSSDHAGHRLAFQLFGQSPPHAHQASVYHHFDWEGPLALVRDAAGLENTVLGAGRGLPDSGKNRDWYAPELPKRNRSQADSDRIEKNLP
ncbi:4-hydroxyphenylacetate 3-hydroxylase family protein [Primorskyibacter flagellatus]|uniref:4-hydroxyphenylacetate 3-monooxygenase n=1 Tax=Primorskyibacter flagellatus TaxID=1387277 RepID=A0A1W2EAF7_9RHOB|nr:4-hydroxyphenylacetate 3-hydroxylase N-terminal domain-containing protein [Primorskyibacter flagellatus]SMD06028.1 4-hydroxyphenylacetate 3-monooxygenase [Primorskyibacter flagellatus]